jgi:hypothetical protein
MPQIEVSNETYKQLLDMQKRFNEAEHPKPAFNLADVIGICMDYAEENSSTLNGEEW